MKLAKLNLMAFGPFTQRELTLGETGHSLHLIYGPNEAGKSTTLRAISSLLFAFSDKRGGNAEDTQVHESSQLRLGGTLIKDSGETLSIVRRKGYKNTLLDPSGNPLEDGILTPYLPGLDRTLFEHHYGLNHERLKEGGQAILESRGEANDTLFGVASAFLGLKHLQDSLSEEAGKLFKPGGQARTGSPLLNKLPAELSEKRKKIKDASVRGEQYQALVRELETAQLAQEQLESEVRVTETRARKLERLQDAMPLAARREGVLEQLARLQDTRVLSADFPTRRQKLQTEQEGQRVQQDRLQHERASLEVSLEGLSVDAALLDAADTIQSLSQDVGKIKKNDEDLTKRRELLASEEHAARAVLRGLGVTFDANIPGYLEEATSALNPTDARRSRIERLAADHATLSAERFSARQKEAEAETDLQRKQTQLQNLPAPLDTDALGRSVTEARHAGKLERELLQAETEYQTLLTQCTLELRQLPFWSHSLETLRDLALPLNETLSRFDSQLSALEVEQKSLRVRAELLESQLRQTTERERALQLEGEVPTEAALTRLRSQRDALWERIQDAWVGQGLTGAEAQALLDPATTPARPLLRAFPERMAEADTLADRLRRETQRTTELANLVSSAERLKSELTQVQSRLSETTLQEQQLQLEWRGIWHVLGIASDRPMPSVRELRAFADKAGKLQRETLRLKPLLERVERLRTQRDAFRTQVDTELGALGRALSASAQDTLEARLVFAEQLIAQANEQSRQRTSLSEALVELAHKLEKARSDQNAAQARLEEWKESWNEAILQLSLPSDASPEEALSQLRHIDGLLKHVGEARTLRVRITGMERDNAAFAARVGALVTQVGLELHDSAPTDVVKRLVTRAEDERLKRKDQENRQKQLTQVKDQLGRLALEQKATGVRLESLLSEAGALQLEELPELEVRSEQKRLAQQQLSQLEEQLRMSAGATPLDAWILEIRQADPDQVALELQAIQEAKKTLQRTLKEKSEEVGEKRKELNQKDGSAKASQLAEESQQLLAEMREGVEQYVRLRLSSLLLKHAIQAWREKNQGALVARAGELFSRLTLGAFARLEVDFGGEDQRILLGVRSGPGALRVRSEQLSQGTRDQLFLALRLAALELELAGREKVPFVVDDLLINFDDGRSAATLEVLAEFSKVTQVIFFTHHEHLLELAGRVLVPGQYQEVRI